MDPRREVIFEEPEEVSQKKTRLGVRFFFLYFIFYAGFVIIGVFNYELLAREFIQGVNLAILYGFSLIFFAILLGLLYNYYCTRYEDQAMTQSQNKKKD